MAKAAVYQPYIHGTHVPVKKQPTTSKKERQEFDQRTPAARYSCRYRSGLSGFAHHGGLV
jgi:hypothetical protein